MISHDLDGLSVNTKVLPDGRGRRNQAAVRLGGLCPLLLALKMEGGPQAKGCSDP